LFGHFAESCSQKIGCAIDQDVDLSEVACYCLDEASDFMDIA